MHEWGDKDFDWKALYDAINIIGKRLKHAGIVIFDLKEKYGTARVACALVDYRDCATYRDAYFDAVGRFPHIREEILTDADYPELLEGL